MPKVDRVYRTGRTCFHGSEFIIDLSDGTQHTLWSPPWNDYETDEEEEVAAWDKARALYEVGGE